MVCFASQTELLGWLGSTTCRQAMQLLESMRLSMPDVTAMQRMSQMQGGGRRGWSLWVSQIIIYRRKERQMCRAADSHMS